MKPIKCDESNATYAKNQDEYLDLPALKYDDGTVVSCWDLSFKEALKLLFKRKLYVAVLTFNKPLQPMLLTVDKDAVIANDR